MVYQLRTIRCVVHTCEKSVRGFTVQLICKARSHDKTVGKDQHDFYAVLLKKIGHCGAP